MSQAFDPTTTDRPDPVLMKYYFFASFLAGPFFLGPLILTYVRYRTFHYRFDDDGVSMSWGLLFPDISYPTFWRRNRFPKNRQ